MQKKNNEAWIHWYVVFSADENLAKLMLKINRMIGILIYIINN